MTGNLIIQQNIDSFAGHFPFVEQIGEKTILVTGTIGLIGSVLIKYLLRLNQVTDSGIKVVTMARNKQKVYDLFGNYEIQWI